MADPAIAELDQVRLIEHFCSLCVQLFEATSIAVILDEQAGPRLVVATEPSLHTLRPVDREAARASLNGSARYVFPLRFDLAAIGRLEMVFGAPLSSEDVQLGQALADVLAVAIVHGQAVTRAAVVNQQLQRALISRVAIEQAKGVLAERHKVDMDSAFSMLRQYARSANRRMSEVSAAVVDGSLAIGAAPGPE